MVVHGAGRVPEIDDLDLAIAGIESENKKGVKVKVIISSLTTMEFLA